MLSRAGRVTPDKKVSTLKSHIFMINRRTASTKQFHSNYILETARCNTMLLETQFSSSFRTLRFVKTSWESWNNQNTSLGCSAAVRGVGSVGVGSWVDGRAGGRQVLPPATSGEEDEDGGDHARDQDQAGHGDADGKVALGETDGGGIVDFSRLKRKRTINININITH